MKFTNPLLLTLIISFFLACNTDDSEGSNVQTEVSALIGSWEVTSIETQGSTTTTVEDLTITQNFTSTSKNEDLVYEITETTFSGSGSYTTILTTTTLGQTETYEEDVPYFQESTSYALVNGNMLDFTNDIMMQDLSEFESFGDLVIEENSTKIIMITDNMLSIETTFKGSITSMLDTQMSIDINVTATTSMQKI